MSQIEIIGGKPDMQKLAKAGRIKLNPDGTVVGSPKTNVLRIKKKKILHESGVQIGEQDIPVSGGHILANDSVWRIALGGPKKYHQKVLKDEERSRLFTSRGGVGSNDRSAPELEEAEAKEYVEYKQFLEEKGLEIAENADFYAWKKAQGKKKD